MGICKCLTTITSSPPTCKGDCIYTPNMLVHDSVTACDTLGTIDIKPSIAKCGTTTPIYSIYSYKNVSNVVISPTTITFVPVNNNYEPGEIKYMIKCGILSRIGTILILYKNKCTGTCTQAETCNKCTGDCTPLPDGDLSFGDSTTISYNSDGLII